MIWQCPLHLNWKAGGLLVNEKIDPRIETLRIWWDRFQTHIHAYLIKGRISALIDTGPPQISREIVASMLGSFGLALENVDLILNTHGHLDHTGGNALFKSVGRAQLLIHREDAVFLENHERCFKQFNAPLITALGREPYLQEEKEAFLKEVEPEMVVDRKLEDNELIDMGGDLEMRVLHLPGHTPGSVGFYWEKEGILLGGDSMPGLNTPGGGLPIIYDLTAYEKSVERLMKLPLRIILSTHPYRGLRLPPSTIRQGEEIRQYLSDSLEFIRRLREAVKHQAARRGNRTIPEIADSVIDELPQEMGFKHVADVPVPRFSLSTVFWSLCQIRGT